MFLKQSKMSFLTAALLLESLFYGAAFLMPTWRISAALPNSSRNLPAPSQDSLRELYSSSSSSSSSSWPSVSSEESNVERDVDQNSRYVKGLMENLTELLDKYIMSGSPRARERVFNILDQIYNEAVDEDLIHKSLRMVKRAGVPMNKTYLEKFAGELGKNDSEQRRKEAMERKMWEDQRSGTSEIGSNVAGKIADGRSALSKREAASASGDNKPDLFMNSVLDPDSIATIAKDKSELQKEMEGRKDTQSSSTNDTADDRIAASNRVSELIASAGAGSSFDGGALGIGGLDDVLAQVKRRVWTPLAVPPQLLEELGIHPVRGLLLYGKPGCGKTLLARTLGNILSPVRPITVVSGPEIMDKFVGSSEKNLRDIFDSPPDIYDQYRLGEKDGGAGIARAALHVVVMDEFDAVARTRGGRGGKGGQGDAGVARDSVVNQLLAKMDGVHPLPVPTLVVGLTNKRSLIEPALLRPGRFEVQVEVPPPRSLEQRVSILKVHTHSMHEAGRLLVSDPPPNTTSQRIIDSTKPHNVMSYEELLEDIARKCEDYSGAALAGVARAAASHALERAVNEFSEQSEGITDEESSLSIMDCLVTKDDFYKAVEDVLTSMGNSDSSEQEEEDSDGSQDSDGSNHPVSDEFSRE